MLKKLRIQNFKCWEDTGIIDMAPITLFFGPNSSGKSSIGQFLMMLKQTVEEHDQEEETVFYFGGEDSVSQLSSYEEMVFQGKMENNIKFEYQWSLDSDLEIKNSSPPNESFSGNSLVFQAEVDIPNSKQNLKRPPSPSIHEFKYKLINKDEELKLSFGMKREERPSYYLNYVVESPDFEPKKRPPGEFEGFKSPASFYRFPRKVTNAHFNTEEFSTTFHYQHEELFSSLFYIGPLRTKTYRLYRYLRVPKSVGYEGQHTIGAILAAQDRNYKIAVRGTARPFEEFIAFELKKMGLIKAFKVQQIDQQAMKIYETKVKTKGSETWVNLLATGFGISQVLPVLVQCFYAPEGSIILIDQPEVHLHPYAQSALADVMIDVIESKSNLGKGFKERNIQLIIETHSEHFLRRLQRRIAEGKLPQHKVSAYFAYINNEVPLAKLAEVYQFPKSEQKLFEEAGILSANGLATRSIKDLREVPKVGPVIAEKWKKSAEEYERAKLERLEIDEYGNIQNWPEHFFGDEMGDILAWSKAAMDKRMKQSGTELEASE